MSKGRARKSKRASESGAGSAVDRTPPWSIIYYRAAGGTVPALDFLESCPGKLEGEFTAVLDAVAAAPPPQFSGSIESEWFSESYLRCGPRWAYGGGASKRCSCSFVMLTVKRAEWSRSVYKLIALKLYRAQASV